MRYLVIALLTSLLALASAQDNPVTIELETYVVSVVDGQEQFSRSDTALPGQVVEYRLVVTNQSNTTLPPGTVMITGPVPEGTRYVEGSASPTNDERLTEYSADGTNFDEPPLIREEGGSRQVVPAEEYQAVRWTLLVALEPGQEVTFVYRVVVE
jgi:uncharacterized repeat protein (TIGR01451 family)